MGYFNGLVNSAFKTGPEGEAIFYPYGKLGKGRVIADNVEVAIRRELKVFYIVSLVFVPISVLVLGAITGTLFTLACCVTWQIRMSTLTSSAPRTEVKISAKEIYEKFANSQSKAFLWLLLALSLLATAASFWLAFNSNTSKGQVIWGAWCFLSLGCVPFTWWLIKIKKNARDCS